MNLSKHLGSGRNKKVRGLLTILKSYNFTIDENTPVDEEVALDPELLGKVFENLLASYNPETATTARKSTGSYYTPREIVEYMVNESLVEYLKTKLNNESKEIEDKICLLFDYNRDENPFIAEPETTLKIIDAIEIIKILDPACGSGAFPMGILHKLVLALHKLDPDNKIWKQRLLDRVPTEIREETERSLQNKSLDYIRKLGLIEHCIYGVDIQEIAIQISKLRFFISLLVEQQIDDSKPNRDVRSLPNLETKFVAANTLIGLEKPTQLGMKGKEAEELEGQLFKLREEIFYTNSRWEKLKLQEKEKQLREHLKVALTQSGFVNDTAEKIASWDPFNQNTNADWFDPEWMFGPVVKDGFNVLIGNLPYIKEYTYRSAFDGIRQSAYYMGKMDIWYFFACRGIDFLINNSNLCFIAQNNWVTSYGAKKMRAKILKDTQILKLIDFGNYKIFENAGIQTMIMIFTKSSVEDEYKFDYRKLSDKYSTFNDVIDLLNYNKNLNAEFLTPSIIRNNFKGKPLTFSNTIIETILNKINAKRNFKLSKNKEVAQGIVAPQEFLNKQNKLLLGDGYTEGEGIFILSIQELLKMNLTNIELSLIKPYFTTEQLFRFYGSNKNKNWLIYTDSSFKYPKNIKPYPNIKKHLDRFSSIITSDNRPYGLHRSREKNFFKGKKILSLRKCLIPTFTYTDFDCYVSQTFFIIKSNQINLKYLTAIFNSRLVTFWLKKIGGRCKEAIIKLIKNRY